MWSLRGKTYSFEGVGRLVHKHCLGTWPAFFFFFLKERGRGTIRDNRGANEQDMSSMISR